MLTPTEQVAAVAEAIHRAQTRYVLGPWETLDERDQEALCRQAQAAIDALGLTEIWCIPTTKCKDGQSRRPLNHFDSFEAAKKCREEWLPEAQIYSQWVSAWSEVDQ
jgi:hypothetical protein